MIRKLGNKLLIKVFNLKITLKNYLSKEMPIKNRLIPLGTNCYVRFKLSQYGVKPKKNKGELSFPFDLSRIPIEEIPIILKNNFADYFDNIEYSVNNQHWINTKYKILYIHDKTKEKSEFITRYKNRINNFNKTLKLKKVILITTVRNLECEKIINDIYEALAKKYCNDNFKYVVCNFINTENKLDTNKINQNIKYKEILCNENYWNNWWQTENDCLENNYEITKEFIDYIKEISNQF